MFKTQSSVDSFCAVLIVICLFIALIVATNDVGRPPAKCVDQPIKKENVCPKNLV